MRTFLVRISIFAGLLLILATAVDWLFCHTILRSKFSGYGVMGDLFNRRVPKVDMAIMGSSRAWVMIDPKTLEDSLGGTVYNYGFDGFTFHLQHLIFRQLIRLNYQPKYIIQQLDIQSLDKRNALNNSEHFLGVLHQPEVDEYVSQYKGFDYYDRFLPLLRWSGRTSTLTIIQKILSRTEAEQDGYDRYHGYWSNPDEWHPDADQEFKETPYNQKWDLPTKELFLDYIRECQSKNIQLIFVLPPIYHELQKVAKNQKTIFNYYQKLAQENHLIFLDYTEDTLSYSKKYFYNGGHLNTRGSQIFSQKLASDLKAKGVKLVE